MKKLISLVLILSCIFITTSCSLIERITNPDEPIKEYTGKRITKFKQISIDFHGATTTIEVLDFNENNYSSAWYIPPETPDPESKLTVKSTFTDQEEKALIDSCYTHGLFDLQEEYSTTETVDDGGSWEIIIEYEDGTTRKSKGVNAGPEKVFDKCAKAFYNICGEGVVGYVTMDHYTPPNFSYSLQWKEGKNHISNNGLNVQIVDYRWNGFESTGNSIYNINQTISNDHILCQSNNQKLILYTANYNTIYDYEKFRKCIVTSYDYNSDLTNKTTERRVWRFRDIELDLKLNKIYLVRLEFKDGDFAEYTFNTKATPKN